MRAFLASVLSLIAVGVLLIAYGLLSPRAAAAPAGMIQYDARGDAYQLARPVYASERINLSGDPYAPYPGRTVTTYASNDARRASAYDPYDDPAPAPRRAAASRSASTMSTSRRPAPQVERNSGRDWMKTAMVIGGSSAAGAGLGAIFGGKKGALIGAAIGGGAGTVYEVRKR
jgi:hypothetical protein